MVHAGVYGESVSYTARSDSNFRLADDSPRTSSFISHNAFIRH
jgi:hypothetical protein